MNTLRSLQHEYELYVEHEIELYKDSISRSALLSIGDEAVVALREQSQTTLTEMVLWEEVDRIIARRLRLPNYRTWRQRRIKMLAEYRRPEHWGISPTCALARELGARAEGGHVLVAGVDSESAAMYSAAHGCAVTALACEPDAVERVMSAAEQAGLAERVRGCVTDLGQWSPDVSLRVVVCTPAAFVGLSSSERAEAMTLLQSATLDGGVHLVQALITGRVGPSLDELRFQYDGWAISLEGEASNPTTFLAPEIDRAPLTSLSSHFATLCPRMLWQNATHGRLRAAVCISNMRRSNGLRHSSGVHRDCSTRWRSGCHRHQPYGRRSMKQIRQTPDAQEPVGIVISGGARHEVTPRFAAFVWAPGPEPVAHDETNETRAA